jgi:hypothetical protein
MHHTGDIGNALGSLHSWLRKIRYSAVIDEERLVVPIDAIISLWYTTVRTHWWDQTSHSLLFQPLAHRIAVLCQMCTTQKQLEALHSCVFSVV